ncbi:MAG: HlyD family secretion protein [Phycisphaerae bacterium]
MNSNPIALVDQPRFGNADVPPSRIDTNMGDPFESNALKLVRSSRWTKWFGLALAFMFVMGPISVLFVPWTQNVRGQGRVIAYAPLERQQAVEAPIKGRIVEWWVQEGSVVQEGDPLVEISDIDPQLITRLEQERDAVAGKLRASEDKVLSYRQQVSNLEATRDLSVAVAEFKVETARQKVRSSTEKLAAAEAKLKAADAQFKRLGNLLADEIISTRQFEIAERDLEVAKSAVNSAKAMLLADQNDQAGSLQELEKTRADANAKIDSSSASLHDAVGQLEEAKASLAKVEVRLSRQQSQLVRAPRAGTVFRLAANQGGEIVKEADPLLVLVPDTENRAVELWMDGNDAPLITQGDQVRLQFEGWPAVQFAGWPAVAVGTFAGTVSLVDTTDDGKGRFRIVISQGSDDEPWPDNRFLRQGVRAKGWVLLNEVSFGYELWRQLNGFPPVIAPEEPKAGVARKRLK